MSQQPSLDLDDFLVGTVPLVFVIPKGKDGMTVNARDFTSRKRSEGLAVLCWQGRDGADSFIRQMNAESLLGAIDLTGSQFKSICERSKIRPEDLLLELQD